MKHPEYGEEPYVIVPPSTGTFTEQVFDGQVIYCGGSHAKPLCREDEAHGTVGYWIPEKDQENSYLGVGAFHVLNPDVELNRSPDHVKFLSHKKSCSENFLSGKSYQLETGDASKAPCTYAGGIYDKSLDVGVVRCTNPKNAKINSFQWPQLLYEMVVLKKIPMANLLHKYQFYHEQKILVFHNGKSSRSERKAGLLSEYVCPLYRDNITVERSLSDGDGLCHYELLQELLSTFDPESSSSSGSSDNETDSLCSEDSERSSECGSSRSYSDTPKSYETLGFDIEGSPLVPGGNEVAPDKGLSYKDEIETPPKSKANVRNRRCNVEDATTVEDDGTKIVDLGQLGKASKEQDNVCKDDQEQQFTHGGDSGCVYFIKIKMHDQIIKVPIGIHRGQVKEDQTYMYYSCATPIEVALQKMQEVHQLNLWFPIQDEPVKASAGWGIESTEEKPVQESEAGAKSVKKSVLETKDVQEEPGPKTICLKKSNLQLKKDEDAGPEIPYLVQETENLTVGSMVKSEQGNKTKNPDVGSVVKRELENESVEESGKEGSLTDPKMLDADQEMKNPKTELENKNVEESGKKGSMTDPKMSEPIQEMKNLDMGSMIKGELQRGGQRKRSRLLDDSMPSDFKMARPIQESENSAEFNISMYYKWRLYNSYCFLVHITVCLLCILC